MNQQQPVFYLPFATLLEIVGVLTLITNESILGPVDIGFTVPAVLISGNIQGFSLLAAGSLLTFYLISQMSE